MLEDNYNKSLYYSLSEAEDDVADNESFHSFVEPMHWHRASFGYETQDDLSNIKGQTLNILDKLEEKDLLPKGDNNNSWLIGKNHNNFFGNLKHNIQNIKIRMLNIADDLKNKVSNVSKSIFVKVKQLFHLSHKKPIEEVKLFNNEDKQNTKDWKRNTNDEENISTSVKKIFG